MASPQVKLMPGTYLEIGVGANDFVTNPTMLIDAQRQNGPRRFIEGARYVGIDRPRDPNRYWIGAHAWFLGDSDPHDWSGNVPQVVGALSTAQSGLRSLAPGESIGFMVADGDRLPLADGSVREVYMCDVLSSQLGAMAVHNLLAESARVLHATGMLVTRECFTPQWFGPEELRSATSSAGLVVEHVAPFGSSDYSALAEEFGITENDLTADAFTESYFALSRPQ